MKLASKGTANDLTLGHSKEWYEGYTKLRMQSSPDSKLGISNALKPLNLEVIEVKELATKLKWMSYFKKAYSGEIRNLRLSAYDPEQSRIFFAKLGNKEAGFIRITNYTENFEQSYDDEVWNIAEVYVKPPYRSQGIAAQLMDYVLQYCKVKSILLETERYEERVDYFKRLGFTFEVKKSNGLSLCYLSSFRKIIARNASLINKSNFI